MIAASINPPRPALGHEAPTLASALPLSGASAPPASLVEQQRSEQQRSGMQDRLLAHPARPERPKLVRPKDIPGHESSPLGLNDTVPAPTVPLPRLTEEQMALMARRLAAFADAGDQVAR
ncbi:hypothetical protein TSOC_005256 [Tetrabaena socialis]|uniref:Uncharacterized protein n=1 Tax=Tetrabaena socialis TaxID=47790 RepID=A0A2J8A6N7_9CHLO|nr:hypothetical protein TSOC_005256 [Tetrabaena socialis]|eukprot:PNH08192.1 hypothetical protein TSOC_005256 [Tetrabaena socialis]